MSLRRATLLATACLLPHAVAAAPHHAPHGRAVHKAHAAHAEGGTIRTVRVVGNQRVETGTVESYMLLQPGDPFDTDRIDRSLKTLYATGLFQNVTLRRDGDALVATVVENPVVDRLAFEGNHDVNDDQLRGAIRLRPRAVFTPELAASDRQRLLETLAKHGHYAATVEPKIVRLDQNRVNVVFEITEGSVTYVSHIAFVGNHAYGENRLREIINTREEAFWRFLSSADQYDPDRLNFDRELLRRFYLKNGFADFEVANSNAELSSDRKSFFLTFNLHEGQRYKIGKVSVESHLRNLDGASLQDLVQLGHSDTYDGDAVERSTQAIEQEAQNRGYAFVKVSPRIARDRARGTVDLVFDVGEGPRVYVERIDIVGNTRTEDKVIRREFQFAEGDAFNAAALRRTRQRLEDLGYFTSATVTPSQGSSQDRAVVTANVDEKATGELTLGGGYSTDAGALLNVGLRERNLVGTGIDAGINGVLAQRRSEIDLSATDPYFLDRNLVAGFDLFHSNNNNQYIANYNESRDGLSLRLGYLFSDHLAQAWTYSLVDRDVYDVSNSTSLFIQNERGESLLSQVGQTLSLDYRDSRVNPHSGFVTRLGTDFAGAGGDVHYVRTKIDGTYYVPLEAITGDSDWNIAISGSTGYLAGFDTRERIIDRFFLGGDNLRGFQSGGAGPHSIPGKVYTSSDSIGGNFIWTQSTELHFPLPVSPDLGLSGRAFVDVGALSGVSGIRDAQGMAQPFTRDDSPRVGAGVGVAWRSPFGLINIDIADPVVKKRYDQTQIFRFGFGTKF